MSLSLSLSYGGGDNAAARGLRSHLIPFGGKSAQKWVMNPIHRKGRLL